MLKKFSEYLSNYFKYKTVSRKVETVEPAMEAEFREIYEKCRPFTMTNVYKMYSLYKTVEYVVSAGIPGDCVECGVWRGGSSMNMALSLKQLGDTDREIYLYDTFEGMSPPTDKDIHLWIDRKAKFRWSREQRKDKNAWCYATLEEVKKNLAATGYPQDKVHFVKGKVEETIPQTAPKSISILRLDTDWYESSVHELTHLFPRLSKNGILIVDDYGHWKGQKEALDHYLKENNIKMLLNRIDYAGRIGMKTT